MQVNLRIRRRIHAKRNHREQVKGLFSYDEQLWTMSPYHKQIPWVGAQGSWGTLGHLLRIYTVASLLRKAHRLFLTACRNRNAIYVKMLCTFFCVFSNTGVARVIEMWPLSLALRLTRSLIWDGRLPARARCRLQKPHDCTHSNRLLPSWITMQPGWAPSLKTKCDQGSPHDYSSTPLTGIVLAGHCTTTKKLHGRGSSARVDNLPWPI